MASRISFELKDENGNRIEMEEAVKGRQAEGYYFHFGVKVPTDAATGKVTGTREYLPCTLIKPVDKATPVVFQKLVSGLKLSEAVVVFYRTQDELQNSEHEYFRIVLEEVSIVQQIVKLPDVLQSNNRHVPPLEETDLLAKRITYQYKEGNIEYTDDYLNKQGY